MTNISDLEPEEIALLLFNDFELMQSCCIRGWWTDRHKTIFKKGEVVCEILEDLDSRLNRIRGDKRSRRKRVKPENTIGGYVAQKIWRFRHEMFDNEPKTTFWRIQ